MRSRIARLNSASRNIEAHRQRFNGAATVRSRIASVTKSLKPGIVFGSFNGAATVRSRIGRALSYIEADDGLQKLQWGRDREVADSGFLKAYKRPRDNEHRFNGAATVRSRIGLRRLATCVADYDVMLQWGRDREVADSKGMAYGARARGGRPLQWGRDREVADSHSTRRC